MSYCENCGKEVSPQAFACPNCGHPGPGRVGGAVAGAVAGRRTEGTAIASLVLGILGIIACPFILSIPAVVLGGQAKRKIEGDRALEGEALAKAGIVLGWVGIGLSVLWVIFFVAVMSSFEQPMFRDGF